MDPQQVLGASELATRLILEIAGGAADKHIQVAGDAPKMNDEVELDHVYCRKVLGADISDARIEEILQGLGLQGNVNAGISSWKVPSYRLDLTRPIDLVEEVARIHGLDQIPSSHLAISVPARNEDRTYDVGMSIKRRLVSLGFCETPTLSMVSQGQIDSAVSGTQHRPVPIKNPLGSDYGIMRTTLLAGLASNELSSGLLNVAKRNANLGAATSRIFEIGSVYCDHGEESLISLLIAGNSQEVSWLTSKKTRQLSVHDMRGVLEALVPGIALQLQPLEAGPLGLATEVHASVSGQKIFLGTFGQCQPTVAREVGYEAVLVAELHLEAVKQLVEQPRRYAEISPFPAITRDVAMEIDRTVANQKVAEFFEAYKEPLLEEVALFDVFEDPSGAKLDANKKSLAYTLTYRSKTKTLETKAVDKVHSRLIDALKSKLGVSIR